MMIRTFLPPFVVAMGIALFVLTMQFLWVYIDEIIGKGVSIWVLLEFIFYLSVSLVPMAMSIGVLLASVMAMGNLAERYELTAMKTAGISLGRIMQPLTILAIGLAGLSFVFSNYLIPVANLKFKSRLYDIRTQKPALSLEESVFNYDFRGYVIRIGKKHPDKVHLDQIMIIKSPDSRGGFEIVADSGEMYTTKDRKFFVMRLRDGVQYQELDRHRNPRRKYPFVRMKFGEWQKVFDLSEFQFEQTDEDRFKTHQSMLNVRQLAIAIDSIKAKKARTGRNVARQAAGILEQLAAPKQEKADVEPPDGRKKQKALAEWRKKQGRPAPVHRGAVTGLKQLTFSADSVHSLLETFSPLERQSLAARARNSLSRIRSNVVRAEAMQRGLDHKLVVFRYEMLSKFNIAIACIIFLFIGAPMGAIIRKGGFGYPLLVAIGFFIVFIMLTLVGKKMTTEGQMNVWLAAFLPSLVLLPVGLYLTRQAMLDRRLFEL